MKLAGALLLTGGAGALGLLAASRLAARVRALRAMLGALEQLERELSFRLTSMPELLRNTARNAAPPANAFFLQCCTGMEQLGEKSLSEIWSEALSKVGDLGERPLMVMRELGTILGRYDGEGQRESLAAARDELAKCLAQAEAERAQKGQVYSALGISAGALLAILLL